MKKINNKPAFLVLFTIATVVAANILLNTMWFKSGYAQAEIKSGEEGTANADTSGNQSQGDVANDNHADYAITWTDDTADGDGSGIYFRTFDRSGTAITGSDLPVNITTAGNQNNSSTVMTADGKTVVVWSGNGTGDESGVFIRAFELDGSAITDEFRVNTTTAGIQSRPEIAIDYDNIGSDGRFVVTWVSNDGSRDDVFAQRINLDFTGPKPVTPSLIGTELTVNDDYTGGNQNDPSVAMTTNGDFMIVWHGQGPTSDINAWYQAYDNSGGKIGVNSVVNSAMVSSVINPRVSTDKKTRNSSGGNFIVTYQGSSSEDSDGIFARQIQCDGSACPLNPGEIMVNTTTSGNQSFPEVATDYLGNFTVTWVENNSALTKIEAQSFSYNDGKPLGQLARVGTEFQVNGSAPATSGYPSVAMNADGQYVIAYASVTDGNEDIKFQTYVSNLFKVDTEKLTHPANSSVMQAYTESAYAPNGSHAAVWVDYAPPQSIRFTLWDKNNNLIAQNIRVDSDDPGNADTSPSISFFKDTGGSDQGRFVIVWHGDTPPCAGTSNGYDIFYREVDAAGNVQGSCETLVSSPAAGDQVQPRVSAGFYNNDGNDTEDDFAIIYRDAANSGIIGAYHDSTGFTYLPLDTSCVSPDCATGEVALHPATLHTVYGWEKPDDKSTGGIFARQAVAGTVSGNAFQVNPSGESYKEFHCNPVFLANDQFLVVYSKTDASLSFGETWAKRYSFSESGNPAIVDEAFKAGGGAGAQLGKQGYVRITSDIDNGDFLLTWSNLDETTSDVYGQFYEYRDPGPGGLSAFGPVFRINSTLGDANFPGIGMINSGKAAIVWEGNVSQPSNIDSNGVAIQHLYNPLYTPPYPALAPSAEQVITGGGRTMAVPDSIQYPASTVSTSNATSVQTSIRDAVDGGSPLKYVEVTDLDGASFSISIVINDDFLLSPPGTTSYIPNSSAEIRNWDQDITDTDTGCGPSTPLICVKTINSSAETTSFQLDASSDEYVTLDTQRILINKSADHEIGKWRFYPQFKLNIPARTPPGSHTATIYFSLI
jgi:hypothetical protein